MRSTFMGLEASKRGLFTQQSGLYTVGHNVSNANTIGYTRQRVNMQATQGFPAPGLQSPKTAGHIGTGVEAGSIQRIRDEFIDRQYRQETNRLGYWDAQARSVGELEALMKEPSNFGLNKAFADFWKNMQEVGQASKNLTSRDVAIEGAKQLADSFNYYDTQIKEMQSNLGKEIDVVTRDVNSILSQIASLNEQIRVVEPSGYVPNDLYDARDKLVDELNEIIPVEVQRVASGGNASSVSEGSLTVSLKKKDGTTVKLVEGQLYRAVSIETNDITDPSGKMLPFQEMKMSELGGPPVDEDGDFIAEDFLEGPIEYDDMLPGKGRLLSLIDAYGYGSADMETAKGTYPKMLQNLNAMAKTFVEEFNKLHRQGYTLETKNPDGTVKDASVQGGDFFDPAGITAKDIKVNDALLNNPHLIAASSVPGEEGDSKNAFALADLQNKPFAALDNGSISSYYDSVTGRLGVQGREAIQKSKESAVQQLAIYRDRASVSSVSLDEEMTSMITFQQAYNANARMITVVDETLDKIINGMGRVGL